MSLEAGCRFDSKHNYYSLIILKVFTQESLQKPPHRLIFLIDSFYFWRLLLYVQIWKTLYCVNFKLCSVHYFNVKTIDMSHTSEWSQSSLKDQKTNSFYIFHKPYQCTWPLSCTNWNKNCFFYKISETLAHTSDTISSQALTGGTVWLLLCYCGQQRHPKSVCGHAAYKWHQKHERWIVINIRSSDDSICNQYQAKSVGPEMTGA